jgi:hypothetical protein
LSKVFCCKRLQIPEVKPLRFDLPIYSPHNRVKSLRPFKAVSLLNPIISARVPGIFQNEKKNVVK